MANLVKKTSPGVRLEVGASVLTAARAVDTRLVKERLARFERAHKGYVAAQQKVDTAESRVRAAYGTLEKRDKALGKTLETLAVKLATEDHRTNPFEAYGAVSPGALKRLYPTDEAEAVHHLVAAVGEAKGIPKAAVLAAQAADKAARAVEQAAVPIPKLQTRLRDARRLRDATAQGWETALDALRRGARSAADEGAPELYDTLFPPVVRPATNGKTEPEQQTTPVTPVPGPAATPTPSVDPTKTAA